MKFFTVFLHGCPRLDIAGLTAADASQRAATVLGPRELQYYKENGLIQFKQVQLQVMI
jgi:hypothetical protein